MKRIAVYCGSVDGNDELYRQAALGLSDYLVEQKLELVYGGGQFGLMGLIAKRVLEQGGQVFGIIPDFLVKREGTLDNLTELETVDNMSTRKQRMLDLSDGCIALPGGPGTLEEIIEAFSWARIGKNDNPCVFYNVGGYYDPMEKMFDDMTEKGFITKVDRDKLLFSDSLDEIFEFMRTYTPIDF